MPVSFLTPVQKKGYGRYIASPTSEELTQFFHINDGDRVLITQRRGNHNRVGFALQLVTVRFIGTFLEDPLEVPTSVLKFVSKQLGIMELENLNGYRIGEQRWEHAAEIRVKYGYLDFTDSRVALRHCRWLYGLCWTGTDRPSVLFERAKSWLLSRRVLLPGVSILERLISRIRSRVETRLWIMLGRCITEEQQRQLENLLTIPEGSRHSWLDKLRFGPTRVSSVALMSALMRLRAVRNLGISLPTLSNIPSTRLSSLARFATTAKVTEIIRLPRIRRLATLVAFIHCLEAQAQDDALDILDTLLRDLFSHAMQEDKKKRLRTLKDLDEAATLLADACQGFLDAELQECLPSKIFEKFSKEELVRAMKTVKNLVRPSDDVYFQELEVRYCSIRRFLPELLKEINFLAHSAGQPVVSAFNWLRDKEKNSKFAQAAPREVIRKPWQKAVVQKDGQLNNRAYTFCVLDELRVAIRKRDIFVTPSWRYADPRAGLLSGAEWESTRPIICRTLGLSANPQPVLDALSAELDQTYRTVAARLPNNQAVRFEIIKGKKELILSPLDKLDEPQSLTSLRQSVAARMPRVDLPEILLEISNRTKFAEAFTHVTESTARAEDFMTSLCAVLLAEACNTGLEPLIRNDISALKRDRLSWVNQNYIRDETLSAANAQLVAAQNQIPLAQNWGGGEVASADGMRFVVPIRTVHSGPNSKYFGAKRGVTWYNLISDQFSGLNAITVPGTLRDSLVLLAVVLEQQTELQPTQIMTDTGAYSDVIFGLFRLLGYRFSPRLADVGDTRFWRIDPKADYGQLNTVARQKSNTQKIIQHWDELLCLAGSLKLGRVSATGIMRTLQVGDRPTSLAQALAEFGRIEKTLHTLTYLDDESQRRNILIQLNRGEARHSLARVLFHGKRGELRQRYREGQEDQLGALGLVLNIIILWNTLYIDAVLSKLRQEGHSIREEDIARLSPLTYEHINVLGRYSFAMPEGVCRGELRPLRDPNEENP